MESQGLGIAPGNPITNLLPLTNDDYGTRQFLYPAFLVPEPSALILFVAATLRLIVFGQRRKLKIAA